MGYNTPVLIYNDGLRTIDQNPHEFVAGLVRACEMPMFTGHQDIPVGNHGSVAQVLMHRHADEYRTLVSQGNWLWEVRGDGPHEHDPYIDRALSDERFRNELIGRATRAREAAERVLRVLGAD